MEKKYKLKTELTLRDVVFLRKTLDDTDELFDVWNELGRIIKGEERRVVTIGGTQYYEEELQRALANIKPLNK